MPQVDRCCWLLPLQAFPGGSHEKTPLPFAPSESLENCSVAALKWCNGFKFEIVGYFCNPGWQLRPNKPRKRGLDPVSSNLTDDEVRLVVVWVRCVPLCC